MTSEAPGDLVVSSSASATRLLNKANSHNSMIKLAVMTIYKDLLKGFRVMRKIIIVRRKDGKIDIIALFQPCFIISVSRKVGNKFYALADPWVLWVADTQARISSPSQTTVNQVDNIQCSKPSCNT